MRRGLALATAALLLVALLALIAAARNTVLPLFQRSATTAAAVPTTQQTGHRVILGTGPVTSASYAVGGSLSRIINDSRSDHGVRCSVVATEGSIANIDALREGTIDLGIVQSDWLHHAYHGTDLFAVDGAFTTLRSLMPLFPQPLTVLTRDQSGIDSLSDLKGKIVNMGAPNSGERASLQLLFAELGWSPADFAEISHHTGDDQRRALCDGDIDAMMVKVAHPNGAVKRIMQSCQARLVAAKGDSVAALSVNHPYYSPTAIAAEIYDQDTGVIASLGVTSVLLTTADLPPTVARVITEKIYANLKRLQAENPIFRRIEKSNFLSPDLPAPPHAGAAEYTEKNGLL